MDGVLGCYTDRGLVEATDRGAMSISAIVMSGFTGWHRLCYS